MLFRYWETVRHLRARQVLSRARLRAGARARRRWPHLTARIYRDRADRTRLAWRGDLLGRPAASSILALRNAERAGGTGIAAGDFRFVGDAATVGWPPDWRAPGKSQLWRYHLHYFDYLPYAAPAQMTEVMQHWIRHNPVDGGGATPDAWHPYVASVRLVNWMVALTLRGGTARAADVRRSLLEHALFIERNLEEDVGGNHLLKNLKAMVFAGCFWQGETADRWRRDFGDAFAREAERQLLDDGGHYERSPMYHCQVMSDVIECAVLLHHSRDQVAARLRGVVQRMDGFLRQVTHPDGEIALFNDSALDAAAPPAVLHAAAARLGAGAREPVVGGTTAHASGCVQLPAGNPARCLIADVGSVCPDDLPAHAHGDLLSYELSVDGSRILVDAGVGEYAAGRWRDYYRSTRAHNTVVVDGIDQIDAWASFRVGRRARPVDVALRSADGLSILTAGHTGYEHLPHPVRHHRQFVWSEAGWWLIADALNGRGEHRWESFCHFHPDVVEIASGDAWLRVASGSTCVDVCWFGFSGAHRVRGGTERLQGWYADRFGPARPATVLVLEGRGRVPAEFGYAVIPAARDAAPPAIRRVGGAVEISIGHDAYRVPLPVLSS